MIHPVKEMHKIFITIKNVHKHEIWTAILNKKQICDLTDRDEVLLYSIEMFVYRLGSEY